MNVYQTTDSEAGKCSNGDHELTPHLTPYTKIKSEWILDLNARPETIKPLEENISVRSNFFGVHTKSTNNRRKKIPLWV